MAETDTIEWPREIWMAERDEHDQGVVRAVLSEHATVARWEGDTERDREFHHYIDADLHESAERYHAAKVEEMNARIKALQEVVDKVILADEALEKGQSLTATIMLADAVSAYREAKST